MAFVGATTFAPFPFADARLFWRFNKVEIERAAKSGTIDFPILFEAAAIRIRALIPFHGMSVGHRCCYEGQTDQESKSDNTIHYTTAHRTSPTEMILASHLTIISKYAHSWRFARLFSQKVPQPFYFPAFSIADCFPGLRCSQHGNISRHSSTLHSGKGQKSKKLFLLLLTLVL
jgi:hypothetical protein